MTLRLAIEIVPYGYEDQKYEIFRLDVNNTGLVRNEGFGHEICSYDYFLRRPIPPTLLQEGGETHDVDTEGKIPEHDRRDGPLVLFEKVLADMREREYL